MLYTDLECPWLGFAKPAAWIPYNINSFLQVPLEYQVFFQRPCDSKLKDYSEVLTVFQQEQKKEA